MLKKSNKHKWSYEEDKYCCDLFRDHYIIENKSDVSTETLFKMVKEKFSEIKFMSFVMRLQNIKQICINNSIENFALYIPLRNYSKQIFTAMKDSLKEINVII